LSPSIGTNARFAAAAGKILDICARLRELIADAEHADIPQR